jgi:four helix bundle protein
MKYERFEDLPVWKAAMELAVRIFALTQNRSFDGKGDLRNQLQRAGGISICNNVAEGFERGTTQELLTFLYIARGSAGETRSMLELCERLPGFEHLKSEISDLRSQVQSVSRQLRGWADSLQNSDIPGQRYLNDQTRHASQQTRRAGQFWEKIERDHAQRMQTAGKEEAKGPADDAD